MSQQEYFTDWQGMIVQTFRSGKVCVCLSRHRDPHGPALTCLQCWCLWGAALTSLRHTAPAEPKPINSFCSSREHTQFPLFSPSLPPIWVKNRTGRTCEKLCSFSCWWIFSCCGSKLCSDIWHARCLVWGWAVFHDDTQYVADPGTHLVVGERADGQSHLSKNVCFCQFSHFALLPSAPGLYSYRCFTMVGLGTRPSCSQCGPKRMTDQKWRVTEVHPENKHCDVPSFDTNFFFFICNTKFCNSGLSITPSVPLGWVCMCANTHACIYTGGETGHQIYVQNNSNFDKKGRG